MSQFQIAVCDDVAIYGVGETIDSALQAAVDGGAFDGRMPAVVERRDVSTYNGGVVDLTTVPRLSADCEAISGAQAKLRRITAALAAEVAIHGGGVLFDVRSDGVLDIAK